MFESNGTTACESEGQRARERWIGWSREQKLRRLHLVTQNSRFVILPGFHAPNLASRVLGLSLRRLSDDMLAAHGYPVLVAETFVDPACSSRPSAAWTRLPPDGVCQWRCSQIVCASSLRLRAGKVATICWTSAICRRVKRRPKKVVDLSFSIRGSTNVSALLQATIAKAGLDIKGFSQKVRKKP